MTTRVTRNNIVPVVVDIKNPTTNYSYSSHHPIVDLRKSSFKTGSPLGKAFRIAKWSAFGIISVIALLFVVGSISLYFTRDTLQTSGQRISENFTNSLSSLENLDPKKASDILSQNQNDISALENRMKLSQTTTMLNVLGSIIPSLKESGSLIGHIGTLNSRFLDLTRAIGELQSHGFHDFQADGPSFIASLKKIRVSISAITAETQVIKNTTANLRTLSSTLGKIDDAIGQKYIENSALLYKTDAFLKSLISLLGSENTRHFLVLFQNPAEVRPGGGFIGSYADIAIRDGQMQSIDVRDIYDPDGQLYDKVVPPYQLQTVSTDWGARDANWFFDFPTSARAVIHFLELSRMYSEKNVTFDGAVAVNIPVMQSVLKATGPIALPEYKLVIDQNNLLTEIQREVEAGKDKKAGQPKRIIKVLAPILLEKLKTLSANQQNDLVNELGQRIDKKDIMFFAKNSELSAFLKEMHSDGGVYATPSNRLGTYLAVVDANVAGGKTDAMIDQRIDASINVDTSGSILTDLKVQRSHKGGDKRDPWWNSRNQNFIQILTDSGATLVSMSGNSIKKERPSFNYMTSGYDEYPDLVSIDDSRITLSEFNAWAMNEYGKRAFGAWFNTDAGKTGVLTLRYHNDNTSLTPPTTGSQFIFVYERQSGVKSSLHATISAPIGYVWEESGLPTYTYTNDDPDGRIVLSLGLRKQ